MTSRRMFLITAAAMLAAPAILRAQTRPLIKVGLAPSQPTQAETKKVWEPIYKIVCDRAGVDLQLTVANDWAGISIAISSGQIDMAQMGPWGYVLAKINGGVEVINMMLVDGKPYYKGLIVARPGLKIAKFPDDAKGMSMQMLDTGSTTGWMVPTHYFKSQGIEPKQFFKPYAEGASAAAAQMATINGQVDLATGWDIHRNTMIRNGLMTADANEVVWESQPLPNECIVVRQGLDPELAKKLQAAFNSLTPEELKLLPKPYTGFISTTYEPYAVLEKMGRDLGVLK
ncbi:phosphate/phosphite/phosphonate ABC transporter substrate-binding protein [Xanthobacter sp. DSM 24535]|uniref:phosphate/phosphite/phosphonate ABC transporter substrate-binding protein n=1 Tax=Roseixanthobacter psychrophilus TaxID=3119917 RepID=UPI0037297596